MLILWLLRKYAPLVPFPLMGESEGEAEGIFYFMVSLTKVMKDC